MKNLIFTIFAISLFFGILPISSARADTYTYDAAGRLTSAIQADGYSLTYTYDANGNLLSRQVVIVDKIPPVITLNGGNLTIEGGTAFVDPGATATDNIDGNITANIVVGGTVDIYTAGIYTLTYDVMDSSTNSAVQKTRTVTVQDTLAPVISLSGGANIYAEAGVAYVDAGATALDQMDGDITSNIVTVNPVDIYTVGQYTITYNVSDTAGHVATQVTRIVTVRDSLAPVITLSGVSNIYVEAGTSYTDQGATALDLFEGDKTANIVTVNQVDVYTTGQYTVTYNVADTAGNNAAQVTRTVIVQDTLAPVITLTGSASVNVEIYSAYIDLGATALDAFDGNLTASIVVGGLAGVDIYTLGTYPVTYDVSDAAGNAAVQVIRNVTVTADATPPVITMTGAADVYVEAGTSYTDAGATALDNVDGNITANIVTVNPVNAAVPGVYTVTYNVSDAAGNAATQVVRHVYVQDTTIPVITLSGSSDVYVEAGTSYADAGATASDSLDGNITASIVTVNPVDVYTVANYTVAYNVSDAAGNAALQVTRSVHMQDTTIPVITLSGSADVYVEAGTSYADAGATASDKLDGNISGSIVTVNPVDVYTVANYTVTYNVADSAGNAAMQVTRSVHVQDTTAPLVSAPSALSLEASGATTTVPLGTASAFDNLDGLILNVTSDAPATFPVGTTTVTWSALDANGNTGTATQSVTINDSTPPAVTAPSSITMVGDPVAGGVPATDPTLAALLGSASASDLVDGTVAVTNDAPALFANGIATTVTFSATDSYANAGTATMTVTVNDPYATGGAAPAPSGTGLTIDQSIAIGIDPYATTTDTDGDGTPDINEVGDPAHPTDSDGDGLPDLFESGATAGDASTASGLPLDSGTVDIYSAAATITGVSHAQSGAAAPSGVSFPFGTISYSTSVATGGAQTVRLTFTSALPSNLVLYKVDTGGNYSQIPATAWTQVDANTIDLILTDGGSFDLDGTANGVIDDPLAVGASSSATSGGSSGGGGGCVAPVQSMNSLFNVLPMLLLLLLAIRRAWRRDQIPVNSSGD